ncbi:MAG: NAD-glutamate dehydrogenase [Deltaproteobacteria bacterium]|nr:NAD-glutamate dehydrogenase [Deltaproteobacteria bacterium]
MQGQLDRVELITRLMGELEAAGPNDQLLPQFARSLLRRVDDAYLFRHRMTTLAAQLRDSFAWLAPAIVRGDIAVRVFRPTVDANGYALEGIVVETIMPDQPFIYDTLRLYMEQSGARVLNDLRVVIPFVFAGAGESRAIAGIGDDGDNQGYTRWYVNLGDHQTPDEVRAQVLHRLTLARDMVSDFHRMVRDVRAIANEYDYLATLPGAPEQDCQEASALLHWLLEQNFVFMGLSPIVKKPDGLAFALEGALGIARHPDTVDLADAMRFLAANGGLTTPLARVHKSATDSVLHRRGKVDEIVMRTFASDGKPTGGLVVHGLFTFKGLGQAGGQIPILRKKLESILDIEGGVEGDYDYKSLVSSFNQLPVEYLFGASPEVVRTLLRMNKQADERHELKVHIEADKDSNSAYVFVVLPKEHYSDELRAQLQTSLQAELRANYADHRVHFGKFDSVAVHFYLTSDQPFGAFDPDKLERQLVELGTPWTLRLRRELDEAYGEQLAAEHHARYSEAFPENYTEITTVDVARVDMRHFDLVVADGHTRFDIFESRESKSEAFIRIYSARELLLTDILPVVDNFGVVVAEQFAFDIAPEHAPKPLWVNILRVHRGDPDLFLQRTALIDALSAVFDRRMRSDRINRLLLRARLTWQEVEVIRAYFYYNRQLGSLIIPEVLQKVLIHHADFVHQLAELFRVRFDPDLPLAPNQADQPARGTRELLHQRLVDRLESYLVGVQSFDEDRMLRSFLKLVLATVRTNLYAERTGDVYYTSFKLDCSKVPDMPSPRPLFEIFVHATAVEGVHLRGGKVARGGIRWSDRLDDYRSEVLSLMATQMLKNAVIVPVGAKGGFVLKSPPEDWSEARAEADRLYKVFIRGLLDVTDNVVDGQVRTPPRVVAHDGPDPYLVVAADKGTAHLSDTANGLSAEYGFWLGDAFASGGSVGYDHKEKGITARGTWVCVERHFREMGIDPNKDVITCVGIGDMSGDVFGNGLLSSPTIKLIGAFDHRHIFLDPDPDPAVSFAERKRLFALPRSKWSDYDPDLISPGGGVFDRGAKSIALWPAVQKRLGTDRKEVSGEELMRLILKAEVHLLWNGGIGTYVKASTETHAEVKDANNDRVRIDASELRCAVIGEGGNLGMTMRARVEFALRGGRVNLDAIDNSGGVDLSDHEVNLKTLLGHPLAAGQLGREQRDALIEAVGDEVCDLVLEDNFGQALAISLDEVRSRRDIWSIKHAMMFLRERVHFSRYAEHLPHNPDVVKAREVQGRGFYRPELAKLLSYAKQYLSRGVISDPLGTREELRVFLEQYFPRAVVERFGGSLDKHFLFDEIAGTVITNRIVDHAGVGFVALVETATDRSPSDIAAAWLAADRLLDAPALRAQLHALPGSTDALYPWMLRVEDALVAAVLAILWTHPGRATLAGVGDVAATAEAMSSGVADLLPERPRRQKRDDAKAFETGGLAPEHARLLASLPHLACAPWITSALPAAVTPARRAAAELWFAAGYGSGVLDLVAATARQSYPDRWDFTAVGPIQRGLYEGIGRLARVVSERGDAVLREGRVAALRAQIDDILKERVPVSAMIVLADRLRQCLDALG